MLIDFGEYNLYRVLDSYNEELVKLILLHKQHSLKEFQDAINNAKEKHACDINKYGDDWTYIQSELDNFDYIVLDYELDYIEY